MIDPFQRDRYGRPIIDGQPYQRVSTFAKTLSDQAGLTNWLAWQAVKGALLDPAVARQVADAPKAPKDLLEALREKAGAHQAADKGTARHALLAMRIGGQPLPDMPREAREQIDLLHKVITDLGTVRGIEVPIVNDEWQVAGSADYLLTDPDGNSIVVDFKTGSYAARQEWGIQLVSYARGRIWRDGKRREWVAPTKPQLVVVQAPQKTPSEITVHRIDPAAATRWATTAHEVKAIRKEKGEVA